MQDFLQLQKLLMILATQYRKITVLFIGMVWRLLPKVQGQGEEVLQAYYSNWIAEMAIFSHTIQRPS